MDTIPNAAGCDSILTINLQIKHSSSATIDTIACFTYTVPSGDETYTTSGMFMDTIPNAAGCDSIITINLTISNDPILCGFLPCTDSIVIDSLFLASDPHQSEFRAETSINANGIVTNGNSEILFFRSGGIVDLLPEFVVQSGAQLNIIIEECILFKQNLFKARTGTNSKGPD